MPTVASIVKASESSTSLDDIDTSSLNRTALLPVWVLL
jgi:hypothetical protein